VPCCRLNNFSDLDFSGVAWNHPHIIMYDYTKRTDLMRRFLRRQNERAGDWPGNYHLCFSRSESNWRDCLEVLAAGGNVAVVFRRLPSVPAAWEGFPVVDGTANDLRFLDGRGKVVALEASREARRDRSGFVVDL